MDTTDGKPRVDAEVMLGCPARGARGGGWGDVGACCLDQQKDFVIQLLLNAQPLL